MKDDNILLEALKEIRDYKPKIKMSGERALSILQKAASSAIQKHSLDNQSPSDETSKMLSECQNLNLSPSDESNQDELWNEVATELEKVEFGSDWLFIKGVLKSQYSIKKK